MLVAESAGYHMPKEYIYIAVGFSLAVEWLNIRGGMRKGPQDTK
jgi:predicted tellurium resistance membrane protein TerC